MIPTWWGSPASNACSASTATCVSPKTNHLTKQISAPAWSMDRGGKKSGFAGYYFHCEPGSSFLGGGLWMPEPAVVKRVRQEIDYCCEEFTKLMNTKKFHSYFGELYKGENVQLSKVPQGFEKDNPACEYLKFKSWLVLHNLSDAELTAPSLVKTTVDAFKLMQPFVKFLNRAVDVSD
jgi:uncharacterized protein (TIGR02453 family)